VPEFHEISFGFVVVEAEEEVRRSPTQLDLDLNARFGTQSVFKVELQMKITAYYETFVFDCSQFASFLYAGTFLYFQPRRG